MKKLGSKIISLIIISFLIIFIVLKDNYNEIIGVLKKTNNKYIVLGIIIVIIGDLFKSLAITKIIKLEKKSFKLKNGFFLTLQTNFFNGITPFCLGGGPFQIYTLNKQEKIKYSDGTKIIFKDFYSYQMSLVIVSSLCLLVNYILKILEFNNPIKILIIVGYLLNLSIAFFLMYLPYSKSNAKKITKFISNILYKLKICNNKDIFQAKLNKFIAEFKCNIKNTLKNKFLVIECIVLNIIKIVSIGVTTYFCFKAVDITIPLLECIVFTIITITIASFIPIPGSSGGIEYGFVAIFSMFIIKAKTSAAMLIWRFITYYALVVVGGIVFSLKSRE